jgi:cell division protein FtsL
MRYRAPHVWPKPSAVRKRAVVYVLIAAVTALLVLHVGAQMYLLKLGGDIQDIRKRRAELETEIKTQELRIADLRKGSRIKRIARDCLGMEFPVGPPKKLF